MNNDLIDQHLLELLRIPANQRTQSNIAGAINQIAADAHLDMAPVGPIQQEQIKLAAIVKFLAEEMGAMRYVVSLDIRDPELGQTESLYASIKIGPENSLYGYGATAEEALKDLRQPHWEKAAA